MQPITHTYKIRYAGDSDRELWDQFVRKHPDASLFHLFGWRNAIHGTYGHATHYAMLIASDGLPGESVEGVLPLIHLRHALFGNSLVSVPFADGGGILASSRKAEECLLSEVVRLGRKLGADKIELRQEHPLGSCSELDATCNEDSRRRLQVTTRSSKVRMLLELPESSNLLMKSFKSKLRSQVNRSLKEGFTCTIGGSELLEDFYRVFLVNMRELASPVHSVDLMRNVLGEFPGNARIFVVYRAEEPVASALVVGHDKVLRNPWASSLRKYASLGPNMFLYLRMLEYACDNGYRAFDFGRSTQGEGTYKFKEQWGAVPAPLYWYFLSLDGKTIDPEGSESARFESAKHLWRKLPLVVTRIIGPRIRKHISL